MIFLWVFLPAVLVGYGLISLFGKNRKDLIKIKNIFLLAASLVFYAWGGIYYLLIMASSIIVNYLGGLFIGKRAHSKREKKKTLIIVVVINLAVLFIFKYFNMMVIVLEKIGRAHV